MSRKPETVFICSVHKHLPKNSPHWEKMNNPYRGGTADVWYSGLKGDIWVEYKYLQTVPKDVNGILIPDCSKLQLEWLRGRYNEGRKVYVIVGCKQGGVLFTNLTWEKGIKVKDFLLRCQSREQLANWIRLLTVK